jgi:hypothetical protein
MHYEVRCFAQVEQFINAKVIGVWIRFHERDFRIFTKLEKIPDSLTLSGVDLYSKFILPVMPDKFSWYSMYLQSDK